MTEEQRISEINRIAWLVSRTIQGDATDEERAQVKAWRQADSHNEAVYQRMVSPGRITEELLRDEVSNYERPLADMKRRMAALNDAGLHNRSRGRIALWLSSAAAILLLVIGGAYYASLPKETTQSIALEQNTTSPDSQHEIKPGRTLATLKKEDGSVTSLDKDLTLAQAAGDRSTAKAQTKKVSRNELLTPRGGEFKVVLEDGTEVWLNAQSRLIYPESFDGDERRVEMEGEAYFKVAKNAEHPFIVISGGQEIVVHGTEFNVNAYADEPQIRTTLVEGSISLRTRGGQSELTLTPGHQAVFSRSDATARVCTADIDAETSWRKGIFTFDNMTAEQAMKILSRWYDFDYRFANNQVARVELMGSMPRYSTFDQVAEVFRRMGGFKLIQRGRTITVEGEKARK